MVVIGHDGVVELHAIWDMVVVLGFRVFSFDSN
jgi:hypothetical protein